MSLALEFAFVIGQVSVMSLLVTKHPEVRKVIPDSINLTENAGRAYTIRLVNT